MSKSGVKGSYDEWKRLAIKLAEAGNTQLLSQLEAAFPCVSLPSTKFSGQSKGNTAKHKKERKISHSELVMGAILQKMLENKEIRRYEYESVKLKVGEDTCWYLPDFCVTLNDRRLRFVECKGKQKWEDSIIKFKSAKKQYPQFEFEMWEIVKGEIRRLF